jgi:hypothetical protein
LLSEEDERGDGEGRPLREERRRGGLGKEETRLATTARWGIWGRGWYGAAL